MTDARTAMERIAALEERVAELTRRLALLHGALNHVIMGVETLANGLQISADEIPGENPLQRLN